MSTQPSSNQGRGSNPKASSKNEPTSVSFFKLFRYAKRKDYMFIIIGSLASAANGAAMPLFALITGDMTNSFNPYGEDADDVIKEVGKSSLRYLVIGVAAFILSYLSFACWMISGERQGIEFRKAYFNSLIHQEIGFFDTLNPAELSSKIGNECFSIQSGIGEKVSTFIYSLSMMITGFLIGFLKGWQLTLVLCACIPVMAFAGAIFAVVIQKSTTYSHEAYNKAGGIAEECLNAIRTVVALGGQEREVARYKATLESVIGRVIRYGFVAGAGLGFMFFSMNATYSLGFWYGSKLIEDQTINDVSGKPYNTGDVLSTFFSVVMGAMSLSQLTPCLKAFAMAKSAGAKAFQVIDKKSAIDVNDERGLKPASVEGEIQFNNVEFSYPVKKEKKVLDGVTFTIRKNQKTALVGESGCGKTTCMQLIERFYDLDSGSITLDSIPLKDLNLRWLRSQIGYVGQEPVLFATTIRENLLFAKEDATEEEIWDALKKANADDFVNHLPDKLETYVGVSGTQLSGGQKQRLAIARAILKNPKILLLDEATSALDRKNELEIQQTLDKISEGRTTIVIAHRLSTIQNADHIIVFDQGKIVEEGIHDTLIAKRGKYYELQHAQLQQHEKDMPLDLASPDYVQLDQGETKEQANTKNEVTQKQASLIVSSDNKEADKKVLSKEEQKKLKKEEAKKKKQEARKQAIQDKLITSRLFLYNKPERPMLILGIIIAAINGTCFPMFSLIMADMLEVFTLPSAPDFRERANMDALWFLLIGILSFVCNWLQLGIFAYIGENLTLKIRCDVFKKLLKMPMAWFDQSENAPGALTTKLATDASQVNTLTSTTIAMSLQAFSSLITGIIIAFVASWQLTLVTFAFIPILMLSGKLEAHFHQIVMFQNDNAYKESGGFVAEALNNMRTVASFGREANILKGYSKRLDVPLKAAIKKGNFAGLALGISQIIMFLLYAFVFFIGAVFTVKIDLGFKDMFQSVFGIMFAAMGAGQTSQWAPDSNAAKNAARNLFKILDHKPEIDIDDPNQDVRTPIKGNIEFRNVWFKYPTRPKQILKGLNMKIDASQKIALVGPSGCGKSTILSLLLRFYDVDQGEILIDGVPIKKYDLRHLRRSFGVVSQEPTLFNGTIEYNIK